MSAKGHSSSYLYFSDRKQEISLSQALILLPPFHIPIGAVMRVTTHVILTTHIVDMCGHVAVETINLLLLDCTH